MVIEMDLAGKLIIKVQLGDDIRCIPIHNEDITYDELILMMQRVFKGRLSQLDDLLIKYKDSDGDLVTIFDDSDLAFAIQCSKVLRITITVNSKSSLDNSDPTSGGGERAQLREELQDVRNHLDRLMAQLDRCGRDGSRIICGVEPSHLPARSLVTVRSKEFDPLSTCGPVGSGAHQHSPAHHQQQRRRSHPSSSSSATAEDDPANTKGVEAPAANTAPLQQPVMTGGSQPQQQSPSHPHLQPSSVQQPPQPQQRQQQLPQQYPQQPQPQSQQYPQQPPPQSQAQQYPQQQQPPQPQSQQYPQQPPPQSQAQQYPQQQPPQPQSQQYPQPQQQPPHPQSQQYPQPQQPQYQQYAQAQYQQQSQAHHPSMPPMSQQQQARPPGPGQYVGPPHLATQPQPHYPPSQQLQPMMPGMMGQQHYQQQAMPSGANGNTAGQGSFPQAGPGAGGGGQMYRFPTPPVPPPGSGTAPY